VTACKDVYGFLNQVSGRSVSAPLAAADLQRLAQLGLVQLLSADQLAQLTREAQTLGATQAALNQEAAQRARVAADLSEERHRTQSLFFHLHGKDAQAAELRHQAQDQANLQAIDADLAARAKAFNDLLAKRSTLDTLTPVGDQYVGLTSLGAVQIRDLGVRLYRLSNVDFETYWSQSQRIAHELNGLADSGAAYFAQLSPAVSGADRAYLWAISIGLGKVQPNLTTGVPRFQQAYGSVSGLSRNVENRLMASEILFALPWPVPDAMTPLAQLLPEVRRAGVPDESALGVAAILLFGRRADGTFAIPNLASFLHVTRSYESAALLAIMNLPFNDLVAKFQSLRGLFGSWGFAPSEDVELSSAYLAVSELPVAGISTKLAIVARGLSTYLQYPLVAAAVLSSVATFEANETLNLLEQAYNVVGRRAAGMSQAELISLAVRMIHGIRNELVGELDTTATAPAPGAAAPGVYVHPPFFLPFVVAHGVYFSTFSGIGGAHPGHVHGVGGIGGGGFVG
jgi:hypothetical protein